MTDAEYIMDAMGELPEDLIVSADKMRAKPNRWLRRWLAAAACLLLVVGLGAAVSLSPYFANAENTKSEAQNDVVPEGFMYRARIKEVGDNYLVVKYEGAVYGAVSAPVKVYLGALAEEEALTEGDLIIVYYDGNIHLDENTMEHYIDDVYYIKKVESE